MNENDKKEIGEIAFKIDPRQLKKIAAAGRLEEFAEKAVMIFARDLKSELVSESVSSINTSLMFFDDDFGTGPRPPHWHNIGKIDDLVSRINAIEKMIGLKADILEGKFVDRV